jgi:hypothetical protein
MLLPENTPTYNATSLVFISKFYLQLYHTENKNRIWYPEIDLIDTTFHNVTMMRMELPFFDLTKLDTVSKK